MINQQQLLINAFLKLGEAFGTYNDNRTKMMSIAESLFDGVLKKVGSDSTFLYNATRIKLSLNIKDGDNYVYNKPYDFLSMIFSEERSYIVGEFIYSKEKDLEIVYCRTLPILEIPDYMEEYLTLSLALELAQAVSAYEGKLALMQKLMNSERIRIVSMEGLVQTPTTREV